jgi:hypothetical protein
MIHRHRQDLKHQMTLMFREIPLIHLNLTYHWYQKSHESRPYLKSRYCLPLH